MDDPAPRPNKVRLRFQAINAFYDRGAVEAGLSLIAIAVWPALWRHADEVGRVTISVARLVDMTGLSEASVKRALAELRRVRMLKSVKRGRSGRGASTHLLAPYPMPCKGPKGGPG